VYAYCLMGNHVHLLMRTDEKGEPLGQVIRRLGEQYVYWYNGKYRLTGESIGLSGKCNNTKNRPLRYAEVS